jgi:hypothetical protein
MSIPWHTSTTIGLPTTRATSAASACANSGQAVTTTIASAPTDAAIAESA